MTEWRVPLVRSTWGAEEKAAVASVLDSARVTMGAKVLEFEAAWAAHVGCKHAIFVNSGSSALELAAWELADVLQPGNATLDEYSTLALPAVTWPTGVWPFIRAGFTVRFVDVDPATLLAVEPTDVVVHLMGNECPGTGYVQDGCGWTGPFAGAVACYSTFFSHHLSTGEGGFVCTDEPLTADVLRAMRAHGWVRNSSLTFQRRAQGAAPDIDPAFLFATMGFNFKPTEIAAAVGLVQLRKLEEMNSARRWTFAHLEARLPSTIHTMRLTDHTVAPFAFPLLCESQGARDALRLRLTEAGVEHRPISGGNLTRQPAFQARKEAWSAGELPGADHIHHCGLFVGIYPGMKAAELDIVSRAIAP